MRLHGISFLSSIRLTSVTALAGWLLAAATVSGADAVTNLVTAPLTGAATPSLLGPLVRMLGAVALLLALLFGVQWWLRQNRQSVAGRNPAKRLNVLEVKSLGHRHVLYVVGYEQQRLLIATSPAGINLLTPLPEATPQAAETVAPVVSFADALMQVVGRR